MESRLNHGDHPDPPAGQGRRDVGKKEIMSSTNIVTVCWQVKMRHGIIYL